MREFWNFFALLYQGVICLLNVDKIQIQLWNFSLKKTNLCFLVNKNYENLRSFFDKFKWSRFLFN